MSSPEAPMSAAGDSGRGPVVVSARGYWGGGVAPLLLADGRDAPAGRDNWRVDMRGRLAVLVLAVAGLAPVAADAGSLGVRVGAFAPRADSDLFDDDATLYTVGKDDFVGVTGGVEWAFDVGRRFEIGLHLDGYGREVETEYRDYEFGSGRAIRQSLKLQTAPLGATFRVLLADRDARVVPYLGAGPDAVFYKYEEFGDFVDFESEGLDVYEDSFRSEGTTLGGHAVAGLWWRVSDDVALTADARYQFAKANVGGDFRGYELDLSGPAFTVGVQLRLD